MSEREPLVSVVIDNYNYAAFLRDSVESALAQTYPSLEVIVVDDGSTDASRAILASYGDAVRLVLKANGGQGSALNVGVQAARGEILCFLDSDDVWTPDKVERVVAVFVEQPSVAWVHHRLAVTDERRRPLGPKIPSIRRGGRIRPDPYLYLERVITAPTSSVSLRRSWAARVFPLPTNGPDSPYAHDADAYITAMVGVMGGWGYALDEVLGEYRRHENQQFTGADMAQLLRRQVTVARGIGVAVRRQTGWGGTPSSVFKYGVVLGGLAGRPWWSSQRLGNLSRGLVCTLGLALRRPALGARQSAGLALAFAAPRRWLRRVRRDQGFGE